MQQSGICKFRGFDGVAFDMGTGYSDRRRWAYNGGEILQVFQTIRAYAQSSKRVKEKEKPSHLKAFALACHSRPISTLILMLL